MHSAIRTQGAKAFLMREGPALAVAFGIAEFFYKWHSFALECLGFLATWYVLSLVASLVTGSRKPVG